MVAWLGWDGGLTVVVIGWWAVSLATGALGHEMAHLLAFTLLTREFPTVRVAIEHLGVAVTPRGSPPRWQVALAALAPLVWAVGGVWLALRAIDAPVNWRLAVGVGLFAVGAMPSPGDIYTALLYHPDAGGVGVAVDG